MHLIKFPLISSKIWCILNSQLLQHLPSEISDKQNCRNCWCVYHMHAPKVIKIGWFLTEMFQKKLRWTFLWGHSVLSLKEWWLLCVVRIDQVLFCWCTSTITPSYFCVIALSRLLLSVKCAIYQIYFQSNRCQQHPYLIKFASYIDTNSIVMYRNFSITRI